MAVLVADTVGAIVFGDFGEEQLTFRRIPRPGHAAGGVRDDCGALSDEAEREQRRDGEEDRGRIAPRIRDDVGARDERPIQLRESVRDSLAPVARTKVCG